MHLACVWLQRGSGWIGSVLDLVLHAEVGAFDDHGLGVVEEAVQNGSGLSPVVI
jgi:hypothetical protein